MARIEIPRTSILLTHKRYMTNIGKSHKQIESLPMDQLILMHYVVSQCLKDARRDRPHNNYPHRSCTKSHDKTVHTNADFWIT